MHQIGWLAGIPSRIGWDRKAAWTLTHAFPEKKREGRKHEAEYNFDLLAPLGVPLPEKLQMHFPFNARAEASLEELLKRFEIRQGRPWIVFAPGASCASKRWPAERFGVLAGRLAAVHDAEFFAVGSAQEHALVQRLQARSPAPVHDLSGRLSLAMTGALFRRTRLLISNDSGPAHIASAVGAPVVSIFGRNQPGLSPLRWRPLGENSRVVWKNVGCDPCLAHDCEIHFLCLDVISEEEVMKEAAALLSPESVSS